MRQQTRFLTSPRKTKLRRWAFKIHFCAGIGIAALLLLIGLSGSAIVFHDELERSFHRSPAGAIPGSSTPADLQTIVDSLEAAHGGYKVGSLRDLDRADGVVTARMKGGSDLMAFWDPHAGEMTDVAPAASAFLNVLVDFHKNLTMGKRGRAMNGIVAISFVWVVLTGLIAWWPGLAHWGRGFTVNLKLSWKRINYDLHNSAGITSFGFLLAMACTAVCLAAPDIPGLFAFGKSSEHGENKKHRSGGKSKEHAAAESKSIDDLVAIASADPELAGFRLHGLQLADKHGEQLGMEYAGARGTVLVRVDSGSGNILSRTSPNRLGVTLEAHDATEALHFGRWGGLASRIAWVFLGFTPGVLAITGLLMWWNRSLSKRFA